ncbi:MAG: biopolymer transporter ExbD [Steroidobacteraceae bacterium]
MSVGTGGGDEPMMDVNTTPLIDVMLVLLILFIITIPPTKHATNLDMPQNIPSTNNEQPEVINLVIDFDGKYYWNGEEQSLSQIEQRFETESAKSRQPELHIRPDKWVKYDAVAEMLAAAQRGRMEKLAVVGMEQYM